MKSNINKNNEIILQQKIGIHMLSSILQISLFLPITFPIDTLKSRLQTTKYLSYRDAINHIQMGGFLNLYRGYGSMYLNLILKQPIKLTITENVQNPFFAGFFAGVAGLLIGIPMSYIKTNYQINDKFNLKTMINSKSVLKSFVAWKYEIGKELVGNTAFYGLYKTLNYYTNNNGNQYNEFKSLLKDRKSVV